jgi:hypothetical protein
MFLQQARLRAGDIVTAAHESVVTAALSSNGCTTRP